MSTRSIPIAIVGMSCRFPGGVDSPERLWELCAAARNTWSSWPERLNEDAFFHPRAERSGTIHSRGGHFLKEDVSLFDAPFFNLPVELAKATDPQLRLLLETAFEALESAGLRLNDIAGSSTAVFAGTAFRDYHDMLMKDAENQPRYMLPGNDPTMIANRISHFFDLHGPSVTVNTACSTSTSALHLACQSLRSGESHMAVVGGANLLLHPSTSVGLSTLGLTGAAGKSYSFDDRAEGYGRGEGVSCIILKPLDAALGDRDPIRAVIRETGMNQDGRTPTITSPSQDAQEQLIRACYDKAGLDPRDTPYVEAHGTGTIAGDRIEMNALGNTFGRDRPDNDPLLVGSVKGNFGHMEATSGLAAVIKVVKMLEMGLVPPQALFKAPNRGIDFSRLKIKVLRELAPWPQNKPRRASLNNFGAGGTNTHVVLEGLDCYGLHADGPLLFVMSAKEEQSLRLYMQNLANIPLSLVRERHLRDVAFTLGQRRSHFCWRVATPARSPEELTDLASSLGLSPKYSSKKPRLCFVFTGQGAQWYAMGRELIAAYPAFSEALEMADDHVKSLGATWSVLEEITASETGSRVNQPFLSFPLTVILQLALVRLLDSWTVSPAAVTGHSSGEIAAAYAAGALTFEEAISVAYFRGQLTSEAVDCGTITGGMTSIAVGEAEALEYIRKIPLGDAVVACQNSPSNVTISGDLVSLGEIEALAASDQVFARRLKIPAAYHSPQMQALARDYQEKLDSSLGSEESANGERGIVYASPVTGDIVHEMQRLRSPNHWVQNMTQPKPPLAVDMLIEIGPHGTLQGPMRQVLEHHGLDRDGMAMSSCLQRGKDAVLTMQQLAGKLFCHGYPVDLAQVNFPRGTSDVRVVHDLPRYQWDHSVGYWAQPLSSKEDFQRRFPRHDLLGLRVEDLPWLQHHALQSSILFPISGLTVMLTEAMHQLAYPETGGDLIIRDINLFNGVVVPKDDDGVEVQLVLRDANPRLLDCTGNKDFSIFSRTKDRGWLECWRSQELTSVDVADFYEYFQTVGPTLGRTFRNITSMAVGEKVAVAILAVPDIAAMMPTPYRCDYLFYLGIIDSCFQVSWGSMPKPIMMELGLSIPKTAGRIIIRDAKRQLSAGMQLRVTATLDNIDDQGFEVSLVLFENEEQTGTPIVEIQGFKIQSLSRRRRIAQIADDSMFLATTWRPDVTLLNASDLKNMISKGSSYSQGKLGITSSKQAILKVIHDALAHLTPDEEQGLDLQTRLIVAWMRDVDQAQYAGVATCEEKQESKPAEDSASSHVKGQLVQILPEHLIEFIGSEGHAHEIISQSGLLEQVHAFLESWSSGLGKLKDYTGLFAHKHPRVRVLEVGAGAGNATVSALEGLTSCRIQLSYEFTDISTSFFDGAKQRLGRFADQVQYKTFDVERDPAEQGILVAGYDLVIACNVLSEVKDITRALRSIRKILVPGGKVFILEQLAKPLHRRIRNILKQGPNLCSGLHELTGTEVVEESLGDAWLAGRPCIILADTNPDFLARVNSKTWSLLQRTAQHAESLLWVSRGATCDSRLPDAALHIGLLRTLRVEEGAKRFVSLDLDPDVASWDGSTIKAICDVFRLSRRWTSSGPNDFEFAQREGRILVPRIPFSLQGPYLRMEQQSHGLLDSLVFKQDNALLDSNPWTDDSVEIVPHTFGLNFRDVLAAVGQLKQRWMGFECAGYVCRVGTAAQSEFHVGQRVCALMPAGHWANRVRVPCTTVAAVPKDMSLEKAASIPMIFATAFHALVNLARLQPNETVLIHSAAGGVGQAAVTISRHLGAQVYATVGSEKKRKFLIETFSIPAEDIFSSRDPSFAEEIMRQTRGKGVNVVLNSLTGPLLHAGWSCLSPFGRFIELGKEDAQHNSCLAMSRFDECASFVAMDLVQLALHDGKTFSSILRKVMDMFEEKRIEHKIPVATYGIGECQKAFRRLQTGEHIGKIVIQAREGDDITVLAAHSMVRFLPEASYLIVGGLNGIGLEIARWMARQGAKNMILMSRSPQRYPVHDILQEFHDAGVRVLIRSCDVVNKACLEDVVRECHSQVPIRGIIQAAAVLDNASFSQMTSEQWHAVVRPKCEGSKNLDEAVRDIKLDFFILLSSVTGIIGNFGQANYTAAGTFQDALALNRVARGQPAVSIDLGAVPTLGLAARSGIGKRLEKAGYRSLSESELLRTVELAILHPYHGQMVTGIRPWTSFGDLNWRLEPRFACQWRHGGEAAGEQSHGKADGDLLRTSLKDCPAKARVEMLIKVLKGRISQMLGVSATQIDQEKPPSAYGVDSLVAVELRSWLGLNVASKVSVFDITQSASLRMLAEKLNERLV
ncbi:KR domain-containing protein [Hirsutella rhossiliensis]|uniref:KR domain-containing protein n=1 Tax=Hirsutella rhossiliensis TaxID=111463 RepID=A0A9P8MV56_9HYPO|nr:KR domain-containing protein [Hirsutella rhossiliensis]KAH0960821.1 KR domain-containing protein [Hirsutella rhossiliensis]